MSEHLAKQYRMESPSYRLACQIDTCNAVIREGMKEADQIEARIKAAIEKRDEFESALQVLGAARDDRA